MKFQTSDYQMLEIIITPKVLEYGETSRVIVILSKYWSICQNLKDKEKKNHIPTEANQHGKRRPAAILSLNRSLKHN